jgi:hypothetical protein
LGAIDDIFICFSFFFISSASSFIAGVVCCLYDLLFV